ncbi:MAG: hypothetical protein M3O06_11410, partial [Pseudomonadota bacterium]|nr:hypothetical protein [Pseudomonadota bacterium]
MTTARNFALHGAIALLTCLMLSVGHVQSAHSNEPSGVPAPGPATPEAAPAGKNSSSWEEGDDDDGDRTPSNRHGHEVFRKHHGRVNNHVGVGHDSVLAAGQQAEEVISILGSSMSAGEVADSVVSVVGNTRVTGATGGSAVSVLGGTYVDAKVDGDVVAVLGGVELGPHAEIGGDVVAVGGGILRDPAAIMHGDLHDIAFGMHPGPFQWLSRWVSECLVYGRLLAFAPGLAWTWAVGIIALALYVLAALLFRPAVERCVQVLDTHPGPSLLAGLIALLGVPVLVALLFVTVIGILAVPVVVIGVVITAVFGKLVVLAWIGSRIAAGRGAGAGLHPALWVLIGGLIMLVLYAVPVVGILIYKLGELIGIGAVLYALLLSL